MHHSARVQINTFYQIAWHGLSFEGDVHAVILITERDCQLYFVVISHHGGVVSHHGGVISHHGVVVSHHGGVVSHHGAVLPTTPHLGLLVSLSITVTSRA